MSKYPKLTRYVSDIDQFLIGFDQSHPDLSESQQYEKDKYRRIYGLRDNPSRSEQPKNLWEDF